MLECVSRDRSVADTHHITPRCTACEFDISMVFAKKARSFSFASRLMSFSLRLADPFPSSSEPANTSVERSRRTIIPPAPIEPYGIEWTTLRAGSIIVDVGGGLGTSCINLANTYPHLRFVVQHKPREGLLGKGLSSHLANAYCCASNGRVKFQVHDMFSPQKIRNAALLLLNHIMTGLSDSDARKALTCLRLASAPGTQLVLIDEENSEARTPRHVSQLLRSAGWGVTRTHRVESERMHPSRTVIAIPM